MTFEENQNNLEEKIMAEIQSGRVKLRSKYIFLAEKMGLGSAFALSVILAVLVFNLILYYLKTSDSLAYLSFGSKGIYAFLESFPYLLIIALVVFFFVTGWMVKKLDITYKIPFGYTAAGMIVFVTTCGVILTYTGVSERLEMESYSTRPTAKILQPFIRPNLGLRQHSLAGRIIEIGDGYFLIQTPVNIIKVNLVDLDLPDLEPAATGTFMVTIGQRKDGSFTAKSFHIIKQEEMPMIRRGVLRCANFPCQ